MQLYRADHVGRLTRPSELKYAREAFPTGQLSGEALREVEDRAILGATVYPTRHDLLRDLVPIYQDEMRALAADRVAYVQMDEGFISYVTYVT